MPSEHRSKVLSVSVITQRNGSAEEIGNPSGLFHSVNNVPQH
jgi:hypothetical protein